MEWYQILTIVLSSLSLLGLGTVFQMFWKDRHDRRAALSEENQRIAKEERQKELREVISSEMGPLKADMADMKERITLISNGTQATLRNAIKNCYYDCVAKKHRNDYDSQDFIDMYTEYKKLGGNSFIDDIKERFDELDTKERFEEKNRKKTLKRRSSNVLNEDRKGN